MDLHFVEAKEGPYPVNFLRNVAMEYCSTEFMVLLDVDFKPNQGMYDNMMYVVILSN